MYTDSRSSQPADRDSEAQRVNSIGRPILMFAQERKNVSMAWDGSELVVMRIQAPCEAPDRKVVR